MTCSFWLAERLARQRRTEEAREVFDQAAAASNDLGLYSVEYDSKGAELLGNFLQGLSHLSHISAAVVLARHDSASRS